MSKELEAKIIALIDDYIENGLWIVVDGIDVHKGGNLDTILREYGIQLAEIAKNI